MKKLNLYETRKLHYGKYLYKLAVRNDLAYIFRTDLQKTVKLGYAKVVLDKLNLQYQNNEPLTRQKYNTLVELSKNEFLDAMDIYTILRKKNDYKLRCEALSLAIYSNDRDFLYKIVNKLRTTFIEIWEPAPETAELLLKKQNIKLVNYEPLLEYQVHLNHKKIDPSFASWLISNQDKSRVGAIALDNIKRGRAGDFYFYVRDEKVLSLVSIIIGHNIRSVDKLVYKGDIDKYTYEQ